MLELIPSDIIFSIINFAALAGGLTFFLYKPITRMLDQRRDKIDRALAAADAARLEVAGTEEKLRLEIAASRQEAAAIIQTGRDRAEDLEVQLLAAARREAEAVVTAAREDMAAEQEQLREELRGQVAAMALAVTEKLLGEGLTPEQRDRLLDRFILEVEQG